MLISVLVDNNTIIDRYFTGEPGLSFFIQTEGKSILFDLGYSDIFMKNAAKMKMDLHELDYVILSHGHVDHTGGLDPLIKHFTEARMGKQLCRRPKMLAHPDAFLDKCMDDVVIGSMVKENLLRQYFDLRLRKQPFWITEKLVFLGEIARTNDFENKEAIGFFTHEGKEESDFLLDDTALAYKGENGLVIITGCSHAGICNIVEQAKAVCGEERVFSIIGGLHLLEPDKNQLENTKNYLSKLELEALYACHCTDLLSKIELSKVVKIKEVGVGLALDFK